MALTKSQLSIVARAQSLGGGELGVVLSDRKCNFLIGTIARDLGVLGHFPELEGDFPDIFSADSPEALEFGGNFLEMFERLLRLQPDADTYFSCLSALHKSRLKYYKILERQPVPTMDQVGPRSLLQYGQMAPPELAAFLLWRKWFFDIDNRAGQETGYLFEPIIAHAIGGVPASSKKSPVKRASDNRKGRQVDCIRGRLAYEIKIRVTIAASGQGRWREELEFPGDCVASGFRPVLVVLDPTDNPKLRELRAAFRSAGGEDFVGVEAWRHLDSVAGRTMATFLEKYVRRPIDTVLAATPAVLPDLLVSMSSDSVSVTLNERIARYPRSDAVSEDDEDVLPDDVEDGSPGV
jgi:hypothetical protein